MKKRWKLSLILISFTFLGAFFHIPLINWAISNEYLAATHVDFLAQFNKTDFHRIQYEHSKVGSNQWLSSSQYLAKNDANIAILLADYYVSLHQVNDAMLWYKEALNQGHSAAAEPLAQYWFEKGNWSQSLSLAKNNNEYFWAQRLIIDIAIEQGNTAEISDITNKLEQSLQGKLLFKELVKYQVIYQAQSTENSTSLLNNVVQTSKEESSCLSMQFFATTLGDLSYTSDLIKQIKNTEVGRYFCFKTPRYMSQQTLACQFSAKHAIRCNEANWEEAIAKVEARYLGVVLPKGGANVHSGILYLDSHDDVNVFKHELLHLLGFIDEYPLPIDHPFCNTIAELPSSHNIVVLEGNYLGMKDDIRQQLLKKISWGHLIKPTTPIIQPIASGWKIGTPLAFKDEIGLFKVNTCQNSEYFSFKPLTEPSALTYFELPLPQLYKDFLTVNSRKFIMPSFHYNIAAALEKKGDKVKAQAWINKAKIFNH